MLRSCLRGTDLSTLGLTAEQLITLNEQLAAVRVDALRDVRRLLLDGHHHGARAGIEADVRRRSTSKTLLDAMNNIGQLRLDDAIVASLPLLGAVKKPTALHQAQMLRRHVRDNFASAYGDSGVT